MKKRIGLFIDYLNNSAFQQKLFAGLEKAMEGLDAELFVFNGGPAIEGPDANLSVINTVYNLFNPAMFDGLLASSTLGSYTNAENFRNFLIQFGKIPLVLLGPGPSSIPQVVIDNRAGMEELINHFIHHHNYRKIAFVTGTRGHRDAEERLETYRMSLEKAGIPYDERYVVEGYFVQSSGIEAVKTLLDERELEIDAIVCSNDNEAIGVNKEMARRGKTAPHDYGLSGFDDIEIAAGMFPGLTTVNQSLDSFCRKALDLLFEQIAGRPVAGTNLTRARPVIRSSCGCPSGKAMRSAVAIHAPVTAIPEKEQLSGIHAKISGDLSSLNISISNETLSRIIKDLYNEVFEGKNGAFLSSFEKYLQELFVSHEDLASAQELLSSLRKAFYDISAESTHIRILENLLHHSRLVVAETGLIRKNREYQERGNSYNTLINAGNALASAISIEELHRNIGEILPGIEIRNFLFAMYSENGNTEAAAEIAIQSGVLADTDRSVYPSNSLFPANLKFSDSIYHVCPAYTREKLLGYYILNHIPGSDYVIWNVVNQLNRSLFMLMLIAQIRDTETGIQEKSLKIETLIKPMLESISRVRDISDNQSTKAAQINRLSIDNAEKVKGIFIQTDQLQKTLLETNRLVHSINDISEIVNIVALNASIQAAHAGQYGRGFAVIAAEVRKLSQSTAANASRISGFLQTIKNGFESLIGVNRETAMVLIDLSGQIAELSDSLEEVSGKMDQLSGSGNDILELMGSAQ